MFQPGLIKRGAFIEDKLGNLMLDDLRVRGAEAHRTYATWILDDACMEPMVRHAHGRAFLTDDLRAARIAESLAEKIPSLKCCSSSGAACSGGGGSDGDCGNSDIFEMSEEKSSCVLQGNRAAQVT